LDVTFKGKWTYPRAQATVHACAHVCTQVMRLAFEKVLLVAVGKWMEGRGLGAVRWAGHLLHLPRWQGTVAQLWPNIATMGKRGGLSFQSIRGTRTGLDDLWMWGKEEGSVLSGNSRTTRRAFPGFSVTNQGSPGLTDCGSPQLNLMFLAWWDSNIGMHLVMQRRDALF
jgi:hypothetical protein